MAFDSPIAVSAIFLAIAWITFLLRCWVRGHRVGRLGWDDLAMLISMITFTIMSGVMMATMRILRLGLPIPSDEESHFTNMAITTGGFYISTLLCVKASICITFLHFVNGSLQRNTVYSVLLLSTVNNLLHFFSLISQTGLAFKRLEKWIADTAFARAVPSGLFYEQTIVEVLVNSVLAILATYLVCRTRQRGYIPLKTLLGICLILAVACLAIIAPIVRLAFMGSIHSALFTYENPDCVAIWTTTETGALIIVGCLMTYEPLVRDAHGHHQHGRRHEFSRKGSIFSVASSDGCCDGDLPPDGKSAANSRPLVSYQTTAQYYGWNDRAWEADDPRKCAHTTTTCVGGAHSRETVLTPKPIFRPENMQPRDSVVESLNSWRPRQNSRHFSDAGATNSIAMKTIVMDLDNSDEEKDNSYRRRSRATRGGQAPRLWFNERKPDQDRRTNEETHDLLIEAQISPETPVFARDFGVAPSLSSARRPSLYSDTSLETPK